MSRELAASVERAVRGHQPYMRAAVGLILGVLAALLLMVGAWATLAPGGNEPEPIRVGGVTMLLLGTLVGLGAVLTLRSRK